MKRFLAVMLVMASLWAAGCGSSEPDSATGVTVDPVLINGQLPVFSAPKTLKVLTHDSFAVSQAVLDEFEEATTIKVELIPAGDAVAMTNAAILTAGNPVADVIFGFDENLLAKVISNRLLVEFRPERLATVEPTYVADTSGVATPIDHGDVCVNFDRVSFTRSGIALPVTFEDMASEKIKNEFVVQNPTTSTPGLAFMLATIAHFGGGDDPSENAAWLQYWSRLKNNGVKVADGWESAYYGDFSGGSGKGDRSLVVSYASSPPAEVIDPSVAVDESPTGVIAATCYRQIEFAGILRGSPNLQAAAAFIEFMLGPSFQSDVPEQMYVYPVVKGTPLPEIFAKYTAPVSAPLTISYSEVATNRDRWITQWSKLFRS
ncbi:MAG: thiamine ABC transporter substrate-binding protein [Acidimicrobiales bacterium]